mgnify:CR=1 FL=1
MEISFLFAAAGSFVAGLRGCQPKSAILLQGKELASWEDLYGQDIDAVAGTLGVELSYSEVRNVWNLPEPVLFEEMEFTRQLLFEADTNTLFGVRYVYQGPVEDLSSFVDGLLSQFTKAYGQAITYPETKYRLSDDAFKAAAAASLDQWEMFLYPWREEWSASENTVCCLSVQPIPGADRDHTGLHHGLGGTGLPHPGGLS